ncbi:MAG: energy transducer TonB [Bacteroidia bacterium]
MKLSILNPCNEDWNNMLPQENGRFCNSCEKVVIDFSDIPDAEIETYFIENLGKSVCGRLKKSQIYRITIQIPVSEIQNIRPRNFFLIALLFAFGSTLFSCIDNEGNTAKIDKIEIIDTSGKANPNIDSTAKIDSPLKVLNVAFDPKCITIQMPVFSGYFNDHHLAGAVMLEPNNIYFANTYVEFAQQMPVFPGGEDSLNRFLGENVKYPPLTLAPIEGEVTVSAIVEANGKLGDINVVKSLHPALDSEAVRVVKLMPNWTPGNNYGTPVNVKVLLPVKF